MILCIRWPKYWSFSINSSNEYSGLISFKIDWLDLLGVQVTLKSLLQLHSSRPSGLQHSTFFMVQLSYPYMTTRKTIALTRRTFVGIVMSLLFNMLSRFVIAFLPRSKQLLISEILHLLIPPATTRVAMARLLHIFGYQIPSLKRNRINPSSKCFISLEN